MPSRSWETRQTYTEQLSVDFTKIVINANFLAFYFYLFATLLSSNSIEPAAISFPGPATQHRPPPSVRPRSPPTDLQPLRIHNNDLAGGLHPRDACCQRS